MNKFLFQYEVYLRGENSPIHFFKSNYPFDDKEHNTIFITIEGVTTSYIITKVTHNIRDGLHTIRLNCVKKSN